jgi:hypothetical protein
VVASDAANAREPPPSDSSPCAPAPTHLLRSARWPLPANPACTEMCRLQALFFAVLCFGFRAQSEGGREGRERGRCEGQSVWRRSDADMCACSAPLLLSSVSSLCGQPTQIAAQSPAATQRCQPCPSASRTAASPAPRRRRTPVVCPGGWCCNPWLPWRTPAPRRKE